MKKRYFFVLCFLIFMSMINVKTSYAYEINLVSDNYVVNEILVTLNHESSLKFEDYSIDLFSEIPCIDVEDLSYNYKHKVLSQQNGTYLEDDDINLNSFRRILRLTLENSDKNNIVYYISKLLNRSDIEYAEPNYCVTSGRLNAYAAVSNPHNHTYSYEQYDTSNHICICNCGFFEYEAHEWTNMLNNINNYDNENEIMMVPIRTCIKCGLNKVSNTYLITNLEDINKKFK